MIRAVALANRLANILAARAKKADFLNDCRVQDDSDGQPPFLAFWDETKLGLTPTQAEVDSASGVITADQLAAIYADAVDKVQFRLLFNLENRMRVLEGKVALTVVQYRQAIIDQWKLVNP